MDNSLLCASVFLWPSSTLPSDCLASNGQEVSTSDYPDLYGVLGTTFGSGSSTFGLPSISAPTNLQAVICVEDVQVPLAGVLLWSAMAVPIGFTTCSGQLLSVDQNQALYAILGTTFGGNGTTNFALPTLAGPQSGMTYLIALMPSPAVYLGTVLLYPASSLPSGYALCNGQLLSMADYPSLYQLIGTTYGGDGVTTFGLPNLTAPANMSYVINAEGLFPPVG